MKTIKIFLSIAGFALTVICFGQLPAHDHNDVLFYTAYYDAAKMRFDHLLDEFPSRVSSGDRSESPAMIRTYFVPMESDMEVESWMTVPFETNVFEENMEVESWMTSPFESSYSEEEIEIEEWMSSIWI